MLETLRIRDYALIEAMEVDFGGGFNALTGETGAGKSILVGALNLVLGARVSGDVLRAGAKRATIDAVFRLERPSPPLRALLDTHDVELEDGALLLSRTVSAEGRSRGYAGGKLVPIAVLAAIGDELVDLHGQHEHQSLLKAERQLGLLDGFCGTVDAAAEVRRQVGELRRLDEAIDALARDDRDRTRQVEFLRFEVTEIDEAGFAPGEEEEVRSRLKRITNAESICLLANHAHALLYEGEETSAIDAIDRAGRDLAELAALDDGFDALARQLDEARGGVDAVAAELRTYTEAVEYDPEELEALNQRLALLGQLKRKYGGSIEEILAYRDQAAEELEGLEHRDERLESLRRERDRLREKTLKAAKALSRKRHAGAARLDKAVSARLADLGMKGAVFKTDMDPVDLGASGIDRVVFSLAANAGEKRKPLRQVASGGEVSRIMLALKSVFASADTIPTLIFDEIDAGVGGTVARKVATQLRSLAQSHQVICITHIPQIAAVADHHFSVSKQTKKGRTVTGVRAILGDDRVREVARLLDGSVSEVSLEHARTLLDAQNVAVG